MYRLQHLVLLKRTGLTHQIGEIVLQAGSAHAM